MPSQVLSRIQIRTSLVLAAFVVCGSLMAQGPGAQRRGRPAEERLPAPVALGEAATKAVVARYAKAENWVQQAVLLLSLNHWWHPAGAEIVLAALRGKDARLRAFGIETLLRTDKAKLTAVVTTELAKELATKQINNRNKYYRSRVIEVLSRIAPSAEAESKSEWKSWWRKNKDTYSPSDWEAPGKPKRNAKGGSTVTFVARAMDLYQHGLDAVICIDTTGSMQATIDAARDAVGQMVDILDGVSPKLRMGLVQYKDLGDMKNGARQVLPLTHDVRAVREKLGRLVASGGGDAPERVANGLEVALQREMRWGKDTNKLVVIIGDAVPQDASKAERLAKDALEGKMPSRGRRGPTTGPRKKVRPLLTSTIAVGPGPRGPFEAIARAGGGAYAELPGLGRPGRQRDGEDGSAAETPRKIAEHILVLSFGSRFRREMRAFVRIFFAYREARFIK